MIAGVQDFPQTRRAGSAGSAAKSRKTITLSATSMAAIAMRRRMM